MVCSVITGRSEKDASLLLISPFEHGMARVDLLQQILQCAADDRMAEGGNLPQKWLSTSPNCVIKLRDMGIP